MVMARVILLGIVVIVGIVMAYIGKIVINALQSAFEGIVTLSTLEAALMILIPYILLIYIAIIRPVVDFWASRKD